MKKFVVLAFALLAILLVLMGAGAAMAVRRIPDGMYLVSRKKDSDTLRYSILLPEKWIKPSGLRVDLSGWGCYSRTSSYRTADEDQLTVRLQRHSGAKEPAPIASTKVSANGMTGFATYDAGAKKAIATAKLFGNGRVATFQYIGPKETLSEEQFLELVRSFKQGDRRAEPIKAFQHTKTKLRHLTGVDL